MRYFVLNVYWQVSQFLDVRSDKFQFHARDAEIEILQFSKALWPARKCCVNGKIEPRVFQKFGKLFPVDSVAHGIVYNVHST